MWIVVSFLWKQNRTEHNTLLTGPGNVLFIGRFALWASYWICLLPPPTTSVCFPALPSPHTQPQTLLSSMYSTFKPQPPNSAPDPSRCPAEQMTFPQSWIHSSHKAVVLVDSKLFILLPLLLTVYTELRPCFVRDAEDIQNWKNAQAVILKRLVIKFLRTHSLVNK